jgi:SulP family sulfate permease
VGPRLRAGPHGVMLGRVPGTTSWVPLSSKDPSVTEVAGVMVYAFRAPLYFANANTFRDRVRDLAIETDTPPTALILDGEGVDDIDYTGAASVAYVAGLLQKKGVKFGIARLDPTSMPETISPERLGVTADLIFLTIEDAVAALAPTTS